MATDYESIFYKQGVNYFDVPINPLDENEVPKGLIYGGCVVNEAQIPRVSYRIDWVQGNPILTRLDFPLDQTNIENYVPESKNTVASIGVALISGPNFNYVSTGIPDSEPPKFLVEAISSFTYKSSYPHDICAVEMRDQAGSRLITNSFVQQKVSPEYYDRINGYGTGVYVGDQPRSINALVKCIKSGILELQINHLGARPTSSPSPTATPTPTIATTKYANCTLAKAAGVAPIRKDTSPALYEVNAGLDRDKDGVACEN